NKQSELTAYIGFSFFIPVPVAHTPVSRASSPRMADRIGSTGSTAAGHFIDLVRCFAKRSRAGRTAHSANQPPHRRHEYHTRHRSAGVRLLAGTCAISN